MTDACLDVDVVIPVFNGSEFIEAAVRSVIGQTVQPNRIIVVDDGSTDETPLVVARLQADDNRITYLRQENSGVSAARNTGIRACSASYIAFLDADDIWLPEKIERQLQIFERGKDTGFVHSSYFSIDKQGERLVDQKVFQPRLRGDIFMPLLLDGYVLSGSASSVLVRRSVLVEAGFFDERLFYGEDWDLWIRLAQISNVDFTAEAVVGIRVHDQSAQRRARNGRSLQFFKQQVLVYSKWQGLLAGDRRFKASLRRRAVNAVLPVLYHPSAAVAFYRELAASESALIRSIFNSALEFWVGVGVRVLQVLWRRVKRKVGLDD